jgi:GTP-binding protein YchF
MNIGIIGLPQTGKKTLFRMLTGEDELEKRHDFQQPITGIAEVGDPRFDALVDIYSPQKQVRSRLSITLLPRIEEQSISQGKIFKEMGEVDVLCHVVRLFEDESVYHIWESIDAKRDIDFLNNELILHDMLFVEKRLERIESNLKKAKDEAAVKEKELLSRMRTHLESELPLRFMKLSKQEKATICSYPLLTRKEMIVILNVSDEDLNRADGFQSLIGNYQDSGIWFLTLAVKTEAEISNLDTEEERVEFMKALGIKDTALDELTRLYIKSLGLISFFTVRSNEVRQWFIEEGSTAVEAAGAIHTDMQRGFIRSEVIKCSDLLDLGNEDKVKAAGKLYLKGKDYVVQDGDILSIRFSV